MPSAATSSSSPVLTSHLGQLSSGLGSSLADIYNTRHAQENRILVATHRPHIYPRIVSSESASLAELYNQRYDEEQEQDSSRQACTRAGSGSSSDVPLILRRKSTVNSRSILRPPANPPSGSSSDPIVLERVTPTPVTRPLPPSQASLVISDDDDDDDDDDDREDDREDDPEVDELSAPQQESPRIRHPQNSTAPESSEDDSPQLLSVKLSPGKRVRPPSVNFSSHSLTSRVSDPAEAKTAEAEEEEEDDDNELLEPLARPRPSTRLIVQSSQSQSQPTGTESEPVIAPIRHHADRPTLKPPVLADDEELDAAASEDRELASPANDSSSARSSAPPPNPAQPSSKASQEVLVITDSSDVDLDDIETQDRSQQDQTPELSDVEAGEPQDARAPTRHSVDDSFSDTDNVVVDIPKPTERLHETLADDSESANSSRSSPSSSPRPRQDMDVSSDHEAGAGEAHVQDNDVQILLEEEAELPVIIDVRLAAAKEQELVSRIGTDSLSESDAEGSRRYPRRARAIQDYNLAGLFERSFAPPIDTSADVRSIATVAPPPKPKRTKFPVVEASQDFFDALRGSVPSSTQNHDESDGWTPEMTLEEYIQSRVVAAAKEAGNRYVPNRDDVQDLLDLPLSLASQWHLPVAKDDGKIEQLESSTRRWLGLKGSKIMQHLREPSSPLPPSDPSIKTAKLTGPLLSRISKTPDSISLRVKALSLPDSHLILRDMEANSIESAETRLRIARSSRIPLPALLRTFISYLEDEEWDRLEAIQAHCLKARQIQKRGRTSDDDDFDTEWDTLGRKRSVRMHTAAGGEIRIHFATPTPETEVPKDAKSSAEVQLSVQPTLVKRSEVPVSTPRVSTTRLDKGKQRADQAADISASSRLAPPTKVLQVTSSSSSDSRISLVWPGLPAAPSTLSSSLSQKTKAPEIGKVSKQVPSNTTGPSTKASSLRTSPVTLPQPKYKPVVQPSPASSTKASASSARTSPVTLPQPKYKPAVQPPPTSSTKASVPLTQAPSSKKAAPSTSAIGSKSVLTNDKLQTSRTSSSLTSKPGSSRLESTTKAGTLDLTSYFGKQSPPKPHPSSPPIGIVVEIPSEDSGSEVARGKKRMRSVSPSNTTRATVKTTDKIISTSKRPALDVLALQQEKRDRMRRRLEHGSRRVDTEPSSESSVLVELPSEPAAHGSSEDEYLFQQRRNDPLDLFSKSNKSRSQNETMSLVIGHPDSSSEKNRKAVGKTSSASASRSATESQAAKARTISRTSDRNMAPDSDWEDDEESAAPEVKKRVTLPDPTPSPSKGGWAGVSGWYRTRDAFTPTPDIRIELQKQAREERKRQLQAEHLPQGTDPKKRKERK